jgi:trk system potassium uptake protein TrkA
VHVVVMGCGRVGTGLARELEALGHSVAVIDHDADAFRRLGEHFHGETVTGEGFDQDTLIDAGIQRAGAFAAVSSGDNSNIIAARVARETFGVQKVVARIYDPKRAEVFERLGIPTIATVPWATSRLLERLLDDAHVEEWRDSSGEVSMVLVEVDEGWVGRKVTEFEAATGGRVGVVVRFGKGLLPTVSTVLQSGDVVYVLTTMDRLADMRLIAGRAPEGSFA